MLLHRQHNDVAECGEIHCIINNRINYEKYAGAVFLICSCGVNVVFVRAVTVLCIAIAAKTPPALSHRSYRCYKYVTPLGSGRELPQCCLPPLALRSLKTLRALNLGGKKHAVQLCDCCSCCRFPLLRQP